MKLDDIKKDLKHLLSERRYEHTLGVEYTACCLAIRYGADMEKARLAGLLHDCAKHLSAGDKLAYCKKYGMPVSEFERKNPELLHAKLGACFAYEKYGVSDPEILSAITWHTTGKPDMGLLEKILYIADYMEPNRNQAPDLAEVRALAFEDIDECLCLILKDSVEYLSKKASATDPMTKKTWEFYQAQQRKGQED